MLCPPRILPSVITLFFLLPLNLYADWSYSSFFLADDLKKSAVAAPAAAGSVQVPPGTSGTAGRVSKQAPVAARPLAAQTEAVPAAVLPARIVATPDRVPVPFSPALTLRSQLLTVDSEWRGAVYVDGGITVAAAATLIVHPGTVVRFTRNSGIHVLGRIVIKGTADNPVRMTSLYRESQESDWNGIILSGTEKKNIFEYVAIEGAATAVFARFSSFAAAFVTIENSASGFQLQSSSATLADSVISVPVTAISAVKSELVLEKSSISGGQSGIILNSSAVEADDISINSCRLTGFSAAASQLKLSRFSVTGCQTAVRLNSCDGSLRDSSFSNNLETGVVLTGSHLRFTGNILTGNKVGLQVEDNLSALWSNSIKGNSSYNLIYLGEESLFVGGNSFGGKSTLETENKVFSKRPGAVQIVPAFAVEPPNRAESAE